MPDGPAGSSEVGGGSTLSAGASLSAPLPSFSLASLRSSRLRSRSDPVLLVFLAFVVADADAVEADRTSYVEAVADVPREFALLPKDGHPGRAEHFDLFALVEHVPLERLAIDLAPFQHFLHERVELVGGDRAWVWQAQVGRTRRVARPKAHSSANARAAQVGIRFTRASGGWLASSVDETGRKKVAPKYPRLTKPY